MACLEWKVPCFPVNPWQMTWSSSKVNSISRSSRQSPPDLAVLGEQHVGPGLGVTAPDSILAARGWAGQHTINGILHLHKFPKIVQNKFRSDKDFVATRLKCHAGHFADSDDSRGGQ